MRVTKSDLYRLIDILNNESKKKLWFRYSLWWL